MENTVYVTRPCNHCKAPQDCPGIYCKECRRSYMKARRELGKDSCYIRQTNKDFRLGVKKKYVDHCGGKCNRCGFTPTIDAHYAVLHFHHPDRDREITVAGSYTRKWSIVKAEIERCELICSNCHIVEHWRDPELKPGRPRKEISDRTKEFMAMLQAKEASKDR